MDSTGEDKPSERVIEQRVRNRVMEYLDLASSFEKQKQYERDVPIENVPYEVINRWEDNIPIDPRDNDDLPTVYSPAEVDAIRAFHGAWEAAADALREDFPALGLVQTMPEWDNLRRAAAAALAVFEPRGRMPEDHEV